MKQTVLVAMAACGVTFACMSQAQETGRVISSIPVISQVAVPRQVCSQNQVQVQSQKSGAGGIMGALAGGAIGSNVGGGDGRIAATMLGVIGGAILGDRIEGAGPAQTQNVQSCTTQTFYENRTTAYNVVYEFNGKQYSVQMPQDPGPTVRLQVTPVASPGGPQSNNTTQIQPEPTPMPIAVQPQVFSQSAAPTVVYTQPAVQPVFVATVPAVVYAPVPIYYQPRAYYPPVGVNLNLGWSNSRGHGHRHGYGYWR